MTRARQPDPAGPGRPDPAPAETAAALHRRAQAEVDRGRHAAARRLLRRALRRQPDAESRVRILITLAYQEAERVSLATGLAILDEADAVDGVAARVHGLVDSQRGLLYSRAGELTSAVMYVDAALSKLDEDTPEELCRALLNGCFLHLRHRDLATARRHAERCRDVADRHALDVLSAKAVHNLGYLLLMAGDLPGALRKMEAAAVSLRELSPVTAATCAMDHAQVLLAASLLAEADEELRRAQLIFGSQGMRQLQAEVELTRAQVALAEDRWGDARGLARTAGRRFTRRGASGWALAAEQVSLAATVGAGRDLAASASAATALAGCLADVWMPNEARQAALVAAMAYARLKDAAAGRRAAGPALRLHRDDPIDTRLAARAVRATLAEIEGHGADADTERRLAMDELHRYQTTLGSIDLQTAVSGLGRRLAEAALAKAIRAGRPATVFSWAERARALSARIPPVVSPAEPETAALLEELRYAQLQHREQQLAGHRDAGLEQRCRELRHLVRRCGWRLPGPQYGAQPVPLPALRRQLAPLSASFVAHLASGGRVHALVATAHQSTVRDIADAAAVGELIHRLRADLDLLANGNLPASLLADVHAAHLSQLDALDALLCQPVRDLLDGGPLVLAPSAPLAPTPWTMLPTLRRRALTVVPSATTWLASRARAEVPASPVVVSAAGPRVAHGGPEADAVARQWPGTTVLVGAATTAAAVRHAASEADVLHLAAHGVHEPNNPWFSYLELADGPLFGYELNGLPALPAHVVLSSCQLGLATSRPGDESLGMTAALLHGGAGSVIASVAMVAESTAYEVAAAHHAGLRAGLAPAAALAAAIDRYDGRAPVPIVCFGGGW